MMIAPFHLFSLNTILLNLISSAIVVLLIQPIIQYCSCLVAYKLGDDSPEMLERLTLNPKAHIDLVGAFCLLFFKIGWAKPLPVNPANFYKIKSRKKGILIFSLAGPTGCFIAAFIFIFLGVLLCRISMFTTNNFGIFIIKLFGLTAEISSMIGVFSCLPLPGFSGQAIGDYFFPNFMSKIYQYKNYISVFLIFCLFISPILLMPISFVSNFIIFCFYKFSTLVVSLFASL